MERDPTVFNKFYKDNYDEIVLRCMRGGFSRDDAEDITQNIFYRLWAKYDDNYIIFNRGYIYKYLVNYEIINYVIKNEKYKMMKSGFPKLSGEDKDFNALIQFIKDNLSKKDRKFFNKLLKIGRAGIDRKHRKNYLWWQKYKDRLLKIIKKY